MDKTNLFHTLSNIHTINIDRSFTPGLRCASFAGVYILGSCIFPEKSKWRCVRAARRGVQNNWATRVADEHNNNWPNDHNMTNFLRFNFSSSEINKYIKILNFNILICILLICGREKTIYIIITYIRGSALNWRCLLFATSFMNELKLEAKSVCYLDATRRETEDPIFAQYQISLFPFSTLPVPSS